MDVSLATVGVTEVPPNVTDVAPVKPEPVIVTSVPPSTGPDFGLIEVTQSVGGSHNRIPAQAGRC